MKITCSKCAADFETEKTSGTIFCPYCGSEQTISAPSVQNDDEFFSDEHLNGTYQPVQPTYQPVQPTYQPVQPTYHASFESDAKANKAVKNVFFVCDFAVGHRFVEIFHRFSQHWRIGRT